MDSRRGTAQNGRCAAPIKILIIDGENDHCRLYKEELEDDGYNVLIAMTWTEGIDLFMKETPDVVTVDVCMADCEERIKVLGQMKQTNPGVSIILLTAYDYHDDFERPFVDAHVTKSSDLSELKNAIKTASLQRNNA
jgi:CheY-like chemotaxis protein